LKAGNAEEASGPAEQAWNLYRAHTDWNAEESFHSARVLRDALLAKPDLDRAALVMTEAIEIERGRQPLNDDRLAVALGFQGSTLITAKRYADAEAPLRECLALRQRLYPEGNPEAWLKYRTMTQIGSVLVAQTSDTSADPSHTPEWRSAKLREAESLLTDAYKALKSDPKAPPSTPTSGPARDAQQGLIRLYDAWDAVEPGKGYDERARRLKGE